MFNSIGFFVIEILFYIKIERIIKVWQIDIIGSIRVAFCFPIVYPLNPGLNQNRPSNKNKKQQRLEKYEIMLLLIFLSFIWGVCLYFKFNVIFYETQETFVSKTFSTHFLELKIRRKNNQGHKFFPDFFKIKI